MSYWHWSCLTYPVSYYCYFYNLCSHSSWSVDSHRNVVSRTVSRSDCFYLCGGYWWTWISGICRHIWEIKVRISNQRLINLKLIIVAYAYLLDLSSNKTTSSSEDSLDLVLLLWLPLLLLRGLSSLWSRRSREVVRRSESRSRLFLTFFPPEELLFLYLELRSDESESEWPIFAKLKCANYLQTLLNSQKTTKL